MHEAEQRRGQAHTRIGALVRRRHRDAGQHELADRVGGRGDHGVLELDVVRRARMLQQAHDSGGTHVQQASQPGGDRAERR